MNNKKSFLLFEVILTIAVLSLGLVFVVRSLSLSMRVVKATLNYSQAINLAYEKMFDLELESRIDGLEREFDEGGYPNPPYFTWRYTSKPLGDGSLGEVLLDISWKEGNREGGFDLITYVRIKE